MEGLISFDSHSVFIRVIGKSPARFRTVWNSKLLIPFVLPLKQRFHAHDPEAKLACGGIWLKVGTGAKGCVDLWRRGRLLLFCPFFLIFISSAAWVNENH